jgi:hypothetical protein
VLGVLLVVVSLIPLLWFSRYYFRGDTQVAYIGWWYHLGEEVRNGRLPLMETRAWEAGNYVAEGQWGLFSPLTIFIGLVTTVVPDLVVFATALNIALIVCGGLGTYVLVRSYGARQPFAMVAGLVVGLSGESVFSDWPSWVNGHIGVVLLPWAWWLTRRAMNGRNPAGALAVGYLIVAVGYVYCALYLAAVLLACLVDAVLSRSRRQVLIVLGIMVFSGLVTVAVYLPGVLTSPVTNRNSLAITGPGLLTTPLHELLASMLPTVRRAYLIWLLPAVLWLDFGVLRRSSKDLVGAAVATTGLALWVLGPATIGPLRWPLRVVPALMVPLVVVLFVAASRALVRRPSAGRVLASLAWVCIAAFLLVARDPHLAQEAAAGVVLLAVALGTTALSLRRGSARTTSAVVLAWTIAMVVVQFVVNPVPGAADRNMPAAASAYGGPISSARGDVMVLGKPAGPAIHQPQIADEILVGSTWYLSPKDVQNGYTTINFRSFEKRFCRGYSGGTCAAALTSLLATDATTGRQWVDLLSVSTIVFFRPWFEGTDLTRPPAGWSVSQTTAYIVVWRRVAPVPTAGGVVATTPGLAVRELHRSDREVSLHVTAVGSDGGTMTLSRLAWPGYTVLGGSLVAPLDGTLVRVAVPARSVGSVVTVRWDPPGWTLERAALWTAVLTGVLWVLLGAWVTVRRRDQGSDHPGNGSASQDLEEVEHSSTGSST